jgi:hypothetical protein
VSSCNKPEHVANRQNYIAAQPVSTDLLELHVLLSRDLHAFGHVSTLADNRPHKKSGVKSDESGGSQCSSSLFGFYGVSLWTDSINA